MPSPEMAREERFTGRGEVCTGEHTVKTALTAFLKTTGIAVRREGSPGKSKEDEGAVPVVKAPRQ